MTNEVSNSRLFTYLKEHKGMKYNLTKREDQQGVTLVELISVVAIVAIITAIAIVHFGSAKPQLKRQNVAQELKVAFERARFDSVKRRAATTGEQAKVIVDRDSFTLVTDNDKNGSTADAGDSLVQNFSAQGVSIASTTALPATIYFNKRGEVTDGAGASISPSFLVCNPSCAISGNTSNANTSNASLVLVTPTGTVNLLPGGAPIPTFAAPSPLTNVPGNSNIRTDVVID